jgi:hypothetical protein
MSFWIVLFLFPRDLCKILPSESKEISSSVEWRLNQSHSKLSLSRAASSNRVFKLVTVLRDRLSYIQSTHFAFRYTKNLLSRQTIASNEQIDWLTDYLKFFLGLRGDCRTNKSFEYWLIMVHVIVTKTVSLVVLCPFKFVFPFFQKENKNKYTSKM